MFWLCFCTYPRILNNIRELKINKSIKLCSKYLNKMFLNLISIQFNLSEYGVVIIEITLTKWLCLSTAMFLCKMEETSMDFTPDGKLMTDRKNDTLSSFKFHGQCSERIRLVAARVFTKIVHILIMCIIYKFSEQ